MPNISWIFGPIIFGVLLGFAGGYLVKPNRVVEWPVLTIAQYLCKSNDGVKHIRPLRQIEYYDITCKNGAVFLNQQITLKSHYPEGSELLD